MQHIQHVNVSTSVDTGRRNVQRDAKLLPDHAAPGRWVTGAVNGVMTREYKMTRNHGIVAAGGLPANQLPGTFAKWSSQKRSRSSQPQVRKIS